MNYFYATLSVLNVVLFMLFFALCIREDLELGELNIYQSIMYIMALVGSIIGICFGIRNLKLLLESIKYSAKIQLIVDKSEPPYILFLSVCYLIYGLIIMWIKENRKRQEEGKEKITYREFISKHKFFFVNLYSVIGLILLGVWFYLQRYALIQTF